MGKKLITTIDVRKAAQAGQSTLSAPADETIVTPMARDEADSLGIVLDFGDGACLNTKAASVPSGSSQGVRFIDHQRLLGGENSPIAVDEKMIVAEAIGGQTEEKLAGGYMVWEKSSFTRKVEQP